MPLALIAFFQSWWKAGVGILLGIAITIPVAEWRGAQRQHKREEAERAVAIATTLKIDEAAKEKSADQRMKDAQTVAAEQKALTDAVEKLPDETPSARDIAYACQQLRQQGTDVSGVPACVGPPAAAKAAAHH